MQYIPRLIAALIMKGGVVCGEGSANAKNFRERSCGSERLIRGQEQLEPRMAAFLGPPLGWKALRRQPLASNCAAQHDKPPACETATHTGPIQQRDRSQTWPPPEESAAAAIPRSAGPKLPGNPRRVPLANLRSRSLPRKLWAGSAGSAAANSRTVRPGGGGTGGAGGTSSENFGNPVLQSPLYPEVGPLRVRSRRLTPLTPDSRLPRSAVTVLCALQRLLLSAAGQLDQHVLR